MALTIYSSDLIEVHDGDSAFGDAATMGSGSFGGADRFFGEDESWGYSAQGDAHTMEGNARGGNDVMVGGSWVGSGEDFIDPFVPFKPTSESRGYFSPEAYFDVSSGVHFAGDALNMAGNSFGGSDTMLGGQNSINVFFGDAAQNMSETARGGNDVMVGGSMEAECGTSTSQTAMAGDAQSMGDGSLGGNDVMMGGSSHAFWGGEGYGTTVMLGDALWMYGGATGGNDVMTGGSAVVETGGDAYAINMMAGDAIGMYDGTTAGADVLQGGSASSDGCGYAITYNMMAGDSFYWDFSGDAQAAAEGTGLTHPLFGDDTLIGGSGSLSNGDGYGFAINVMYGDSGSEFNLQYLFDFLNDSVAGAAAHDTVSATGAPTEDPNGEFVFYGRDTMTGGDLAINFIVGDADYMYSHEVGGGDTATGGNQALNVIAGDALEMYNGSFGGNDTITGGDNALNLLAGDAGYMDWGSVGGNDLITAGSYNGDGYGPGPLSIQGGPSSYSVLVGDAFYMDDGSVGGNDTLVSGNGNDVMYGDAVYMSCEATGGNDTFVFLANNGHDQVMDFQQTDGDSSNHDVIDLSALGYTSLQELIDQGRIEENCDGTVLFLGSEDDMCADTVEIVGVWCLQDSDFVFATAQG